MSDIYISPATAIKTYDVSRPTLVRWGRLGKIRYLRCGTGDRAAHRYHKHDLDRYFGSRSQAGVGGNEETRKVYLYARVSSSKQKEAGDLARQIESLKTHCKDYDRVIADVASGLNFKRRGLLSILEQIEAGNVSKVVVTYRDRLARFGIELLERTFEKYNVALDVVSNKDTENSGNAEQELSEDLLAICNYFVAKNNGRRAAAFYRDRKQKSIVKGEKAATENSRDQA
jgi:predicted site-specific integrase-resolvase